MKKNLLSLLSLTTVILFALVSHADDSLSTVYGQNRCL